ncbi:MAG TPA: hypothetical protein VHM93_26695 [Candidatus Acidoferrum sp.]|jgi:hypothetical protein|nr:hypothetical protein [Candidatus Acidoferrum sp.]
MAMAAFLRKRIARAFPDRESFLAKKVVYNGSHAGDLRFSEMSLLGQEIDELDSPRREGNGMVF